MSSQRRKITQHGITLSLPASTSSRWTAGRKVAVITAIRVEAVTFSGPVNATACRMRNCPRGKPHSTRTELPASKRSIDRSALKTGRSPDLFSVRADGGDGVSGLSTGSRGALVVKLGDEIYGAYLDKEQALLDAIDAAHDALERGCAAQVWLRNGTTATRVF